MSKIVLNVELGQMHCSLYHRAANPCYAHASKTCFVPCSRFRAGNESGFCCYYPCSWHFACCSLAWESPVSKRVSRSTATAYSIRCRQTYIQEFQIISPKRFFHPANRPNPAKAGNPGATRFSLSIPTRQPWNSSSGSASRQNRPG